MKPVLLLRPAWAIAFVLALAVMVVSVPGVAAAIGIGDWVGSWFHFKTPGMESSMNVGGFDAFTPYSPHYLPEGFDISGAGGTTAPDFDRLELTYSHGSQFVTLLQSKAPGTDDLPHGKNLRVNGVDSVFVPVFAISSEQLQQKIPSIPIIKDFDYGTTSLLAWRIGEIKIEMVSNLPEEEILKIAQSLAPAKIEAGEHPFDVALITTRISSLGIACSTASLDSFAFPVFAPFAS